MKKHLILSIFVMLSISGCAITSVTGFIDPAYTSTKFTSPLVYAHFSDIALKKKMEYKMVKKLRGKRVDAIAHSDLYPPTRTYSTKEEDEVFQHYGRDSVIAILFKSDSSQKVYVPKTTTSTGNVSAYGNTAYLNSTTQTYGGYSLNKPIHNYEVKLADGKSKNIAWIGSAQTKGDTTANMDIMFGSLASKISSELVAKGLIVKSLEESVEKNKKNRKSGWN